jgi:hypothetical protein
MLRHGIDRGSGSSYGKWARPGGTTYADMLGVVLVPTS